MKKICNFFVLFFLILALLPSTGMLWLGESPATANEIQAPFPHILKEGLFNTSVLADFSKYFEDHFAFRTQLSTLWAEFYAQIFHVSVEEQVLMGKDDWLFFADTLDDYMGDVLTIEEVHSIAERLTEIQEYCLSQGKQFLFVIAPNKNSLYPQYMPNRIPRRLKTDIALLYNLLDERKVGYVNLYSAFQMKEDVLYFHTDSHWNSKGAALAADTILQQLNISSDFYSMGYTDLKLHTGDLYEMLYPAGKKKEEDYICNYPFSYVELNNSNHGNAITIQTVNPDTTGSLFCWRDSFGVSLYPYLAQCFSAATFSRSSAFDISRLDGNYDVVILEIVERNLVNLVNSER